MTSLNTAYTLKHFGEFTSYTLYGKYYTSSRSGNYFIYYKPKNYSKVWDKSDDVMICIN